MSDKSKGDESAATDPNVANLMDDNGSEAREANGRFMPGHTHSRGKRKSQDRFRDLFEKVITEEDFKSVVKSLVDQAIGGDVQAAKLILERCMGKELDRIELDLEQKAKVLLYFPDDGRETRPA